MYHYVISYDLINSKKFNGSYRDEIITFLLKRRAYDLASYVTTNIHFRSSEEMSFWIKELKLLNNDIVYHVVQVATNSLNYPIMDIHYNIIFSNEFESDVERIQTSI